MEVKVVGNDWQARRAHRAGLAARVEAYMNECRKDSLGGGPSGPTQRGV